MTRGIVRIWIGPLIDLKFTRVRRNKYQWNKRIVPQEKEEEEFDGVGIC